MAGIIDWMGRAPANAPGTNNLGILGAAITDAVAGAQGRRSGALEDLQTRGLMNDRYARSVGAEDRQRALGQKVREAYATGDMQQVRNVLIELASQGEDVSSIIPALKFGQPQFEEVDPTKDRYKIDPITGTRTLEAKGTAPFKMPQTRSYERGAETITEQFDPATGTFSPLATAPRYKPSSGDGGADTVVVGNQLVNRRTGQPVYTAPKKPMPASLQKAESEDIDAIQTGRAIAADLGVIKQQLDTGALTLSPVANAGAAVMNATGFSNENSRRIATLKSSLEKMRNDSLRLNKGVQTEGDAQRAWNELFQSMNDQELVKQRLAEIEAINQRAADLRAQQIDLRRQNYGLDPFDASQINPDAALGGPGTTGEQPKPRVNVPASPANLPQKNQETRSIGGKTYIKINGQWFEQ